jgi:Fur family ferric uptake transcriptional regulator
MECDLIRDVGYTDGHRHYEPVYGYGHHCHLRCIKCSKVIEFVEKELKEIERRLEQEYNFQIVEHSLGVTGYCSACEKDV